MRPKKVAARGVDRRVGRRLEILMLVAPKQTVLRLTANLVAAHPVKKLDEVGACTRNDLRRAKVSVPALNHATAIDGSNGTPVRNRDDHLSQHVARETKIHLHVVIDRAEIDPTVREFSEETERELDNVMPARQAVVVPAREAMHHPIVEQGDAD